MSIKSNPSGQNGGDCPADAESALRHAQSVASQFFSAHGVKITEDSKPISESADYVSLAPPVVKFRIEINGEAESTNYDEIYAEMRRYEAEVNASLPDFTEHLSGTYKDKIEDWLIEIDLPPAILYAVLPDGLLPMATPELVVEWFRLPLEHRCTAAYAIDVCCSHISPTRREALKWVIICYQSLTDAMGVPSELTAYPHKQVMDLCAKAWQLGAAITKYETLKDPILVKHFRASKNSSDANRGENAKRPWQKIAYPLCVQWCSEDPEMNMTELVKKIKKAKIDGLPNDSAIEAAIRKMTKKTDSPLIIPNKGGRRQKKKG